MLDLALTFPERHTPKKSADSVEVVNPQKCQKMSK